MGRPDMIEKFVLCAMKGEDVGIICDELCRDTTTDETVDSAIVPDRACMIPDEKDGNPRTILAELTSDEAKMLMEDARVHSVTRVPSVRPSIMTVQNANFTRAGNHGDDDVNWGLRRHTVAAHESGSENDIFMSNYNYSLDGTGVDVVIQDDGIQVDHPEFQDANGVSRVKQIDWYAESGVGGVMPAHFYETTSNDKLYNGGAHGTHVASIIAGKTYGWAKNADIYSMRIFGGSDHEIDYIDSFDIIRKWHENKPIDIATGKKRPTVLNQSWGIAYYYQNSENGSPTIKEIYYHGSLQEDGGRLERAYQYGMVNDTHPVSLPSVDVEQEQLTDAGIICVHSAGNTFHASSDHTDPNFMSHYTRDDLWAGFVDAGDPIYYNRPMSPVSDDTVVVGAVNNLKDVHGETADSRSERGSRIDVWAAGVGITSATSNSSEDNYVRDYPLDSSFSITTLNGSSIAAAQVSGAVALLAQIHPEMTSLQAKNFLRNNSVEELVDTVTDNDWAEKNSTGSLYGSDGKLLYWPYGNSTTTTFSSTTVTNSGLS